MWFMFEGFFWMVILCHPHPLRLCHPDVAGPEGEDTRHVADFFVEL